MGVQSGLQLPVEYEKNPKERQHYNLGHNVAILARAHHQPAVSLTSCLHQERLSAFSGGNGFIADIELFSRVCPVPPGLAQHGRNYFSFHQAQGLFSDFFQTERFSVV